jgi:phosphoribosylglycinamide formyltransferase-1
MSEPPIRIATLISGGGRTVENLVHQIAAGELDARIVAVICSRPGIKGIERGRNLGLAVHVVNRKDYDTPAEFSKPIWRIIREAQADLVCLCGFLSLLTIPEDYRGRVINIHPALLPKFGGPGMYGHHVHEAVIAAAETESGCTVHHADVEYDTGATIVQRKVAVEPGDDADALAARVFEQECIAYPQAIRIVAAQLRAC